MYEYGDPSSYFEPNEFEQQIDEFKESLRTSVKEEIAKEITDLKATVKEQAGKLVNLALLENNAMRARQEYEHKAAQASREARAAVEKEGLRKLLGVLAEPRYRIAITYRQPPKCDKCNEERRIPYTTPMGRKAAERCDCSESESFYEVQEQYVHEVAKHGGEVVVWYENVKRHTDVSDRDSIGSPTVLKSPKGVPFEKLVKSARDYGFGSKEEALQVASALNKERAARLKEGAKSDGPW